jgi:hypothetical protein
MYLDSLDQPATSWHDWTRIRRDFFRSVRSKSLRICVGVFIVLGIFFLIAIVAAYFDINSESQANPNPSKSITG